ncbi:hypothetical protein CO583_04460 [Parasaccharibacter sp. TMW2.1882]|uniref:glycine-rich domain-containing protein n=1 Tax=unclassified Parasaccharibacter TaxID=2626400 RepID=UPI00200AA9EC|nr:MULTISPECIES: hypothetical protein [unclassified Parasaccharibacter]MCK8636195.1 hypothetical protein [Parasaccharibacter sp. TMW2.1885]MCL1496764.1 hypothetical protein [Parasaccharibacter sp. TMW2.1882]
MKTSDLPEKITVPFAQNAGLAYRRDIPLQSSDAGAASFMLGFPALTFQPTGAGGTPPDGRDMNGILFALSSIARAWCAGTTMTFDASFAHDVGGYPLGAVLRSATDPTILLISQQDGNMTNPATDPDGTYWRRIGNDEALQHTLGALSDRLDSRLSRLDGASANLLFASLYQDGSMPAPPAWATRLHVVALGAGGGGANCQAWGEFSNTNSSGGGGGAGAYAEGIFSISPADTLSVRVGRGGTTEQPGGDTVLFINGTAVMTAGGGRGASWQAKASSAGAPGGSAHGGNILMQSGAPGSDGQNGPFILVGNGGDSAFGGGGRAGAQGGLDASSFGAGGGGAYDAFSKNTLFSGGTGGNGLIRYRWLV